jgi:ABC-2 type transport system permease protein
LSDRHPRWTIARRDLASLSREKTIVLALAIQLFIAAFSSFLVVGLTSLYDPSGVEGGEIEIAISETTEANLLAAARETDGVELVTYEDRAAALAAFDRGDVGAVLSTTAVATDDGSGIEVNAVVPAESLRTTLIVNQVRELLIQFERVERADRTAFVEFTSVDVPAENGGENYFTFTHTILIPLLLFLPAFISGSVAVDSITEEIEHGTLELLRAAPLSLVDIVDGKAAGMVVLAPLQAGLWILLLRLNGIDINHVPWLLAFVTAIAAITVVVGIVLGLATAKRRQAQLLYSILVLVLFGATLALPEHPASTIARLSVDSATTLTFAHVAGFAALAIGLYALTRRYAGTMNVESL